jgi:hypothetical protein
MSGTSITKNVTTTLLTESVKLAWLLINIDQQLAKRTYTAPRPCGRLYGAVAEWRAGVSLELSKRLMLAGEALEGWTERTAERLGVEVMDVLAPLAATRID